MLKPLETALPKLKRHICGAVPHYETRQYVKNASGAILATIRVSCECGTAIEVGQTYDASCDVFLPSHYQKAADEWNYKNLGFVDAPQLLTCPCCGGEADYSLEWDTEGLVCWPKIICCDCGLNIKLYTCLSIKDLKYLPQSDYNWLAARWNRRTPSYPSEE